MIKKILDLPINKIRQKETKSYNSKHQQTKPLERIIPKITCKNNLSFLHIHALLIYKRYTKIHCIKKKMEKMRTIKSIEQLVLVSFTYYYASTPSLSTWWSSTVLKGNLISGEASRLDAFSGYLVHT